MTQPADLPFDLPPADADLTEFTFIPLEIGRLKQSKAWLVCKRRPELAFYSLNLWMHAWHQIPAGSIEDDDDVIADAAKCDPKQWGKVKKDVMRGWVLHQGRFYHPFLCKLVIEKWTDRLIHRWERECDRIRKENKNREKKNLEPIQFPPKPVRKADGSATEIHKPSARIPAENALKGKGEGEGKGESLQQAAENLSAGKPSEPGPAQALHRDTPARRIMLRFEALRAELWPNDPSFAAPSLTLIEQAVALLDGNHALEPVILETMERGMRKASLDGDPAPNSLKAYRLSIGTATRRHLRVGQDAQAGVTQSVEPQVIQADHLTPAQWRAKIKDWSVRHRCRAELWPGPGAAPGDPKCLAPREVLVEFGITVQVEGSAA